MTTIANFDIATDLKVEFYLPRVSENIFVIGVSLIGGVNVLSNAGQFIIGESLLGGDDIIGASGFAWQDLACTINNVQTTLGGQVQDQTYFQPEPAKASIVLQSYDFDPNHNPAFRPGTPMRIRLDDGTVNQIIWQGTIDTIGGTYVIDGENRLQVVGFDNYKRIANTRIDLFDTDTDFPAGWVTPYEQLEVIAEQLGTSMHADSVDNGGEIPGTLEDDIIPTSKILEAIQVGLGLFWLDAETQEFVFVPRPSSGTVPPGTYVIGNNHGEANHLCMSDLQTRADGDVVFNSLKVTLKSDEATSVLVENPDSIELYGKFATDVTLNTTDADELQRWANAVFNQSPTNLVESVETPAIDRLNNLTEAAFFKPGTLIGVKYDEDVLAIDDYYTITKVSHYIDPNNWLTTLDLWKEA